MRNCTHCSLRAHGYDLDLQQSIASHSVYYYAHCKIRVDKFISFINISYFASYSPFTRKCTRDTFFVKRTRIVLFRVPYEKYISSGYEIYFSFTYVILKSRELVWIRYVLIFRDVVDRWRLLLRIQHKWNRMNYLCLSQLSYCVGIQNIMLWRCYVLHVTSVFAHESSL